jgi:hypothetical protein
MQADRQSTSSEAQEIAAAVAADQAIAKADGKERERPRGRKAKTSDHQEAVIRLEELNPLAIETMLTDFRNAKDAATILDESVKAWAQKAGIQSSVLRKFIAAKASEGFADKKRDALQLSLLFEEIPE